MIQTPLQQSPTMWDKLIEWSLFFVLGLLAAYLLDRFFRLRPKILVSINWGADPNGGISKGKSSRTSGSSREELSVSFMRQLHLKNNSKYDALDLELVWPGDKPLYPISIEPHTHLRAFDTYDKEFDVHTTMLRSALDKGLDQSSVLPPELRWAQFAIAYHNDKGKRFYTRLTFENGKPPINSFHWRKPKLSTVGNGR